jgi:desulfoferrodoxin (superoxide reductase-like protein)
MNTIELKAYQPKRNPELVARPVQNEFGYLVTGQGKEGVFELLSEAEKKKLPFVVQNDTAVKLTDGMIMHLDSPKDQINWEWLKKHPYITMTKLATPPKDAAFYVFDPTKNAVERSSREKRRNKVMAQVYDLSETELRALAGALGIGTGSGLLIEQLETYVSDRVNADIASVEKLLGRRELIAAKFLYFQARNKSIIVKSNGWIKYGEDLRMGVTDDEAVEFMLLPENEEVVLAIRQSLNAPD